MFGRIIVLISRNWMAISRLFIVGVLTINGAYRYVLEWYYYNKKRKLFEQYYNGFIYKGNYYLPGGSRTKEIPKYIPEIRENEIKNMKKILNAEIPVMFTNEGG